MNKLNYSNGRSWPYNLNVLESYIVQLIENQNEIIEWIESQKKTNEQDNNI
jgi:hypothetical protein